MIALYQYSKHAFSDWIIGHYAKEASRGEVQDNFGLSYDTRLLAKLTAPTPFAKPQGVPNSNLRACHTVTSQ